MKWLPMICAFAITAQVAAPQGLTITTSSPLPAAIQDTAYSQQLAAAGGVGTLTWSIPPQTAGSPLPPGLTFSASGSFSGTPTKAGTYSVPVNVSDTRQQTASKTFSITVQLPPLVITNSSPLPAGTPTVSYSYVFNATGGTGTYSWRLSSGTLPPGLTFSSTPPTGRITGSPTTVGVYQFSVSVIDSQENTTVKQFSLTIQSQVLTITSSSPVPNGATGALYSYRFDASGGAPPYQWSTSSGSLPAGLALATDGSLTGTPTAAGQYTFTIRVTDSPGQSLAAQVATKTFSLRITEPLSVTTLSPINGAIGSSLTVVMTATGGTPIYLWSVAPGSQLPPGFTLDTASGFLSGTPAAAGTYNFAVQVTDSVQNTATKALVLIVQAGIAITSASPAPNAAAGVNYSLTLAAAGGNPPYTWALESGALPAGITLNTSTGVLSGTPQGTGAFSFVIRVTDSAKATVTKPFSLTVGTAQPVLLSTNNLDFSALSGGDAPPPQSFALITPAAQPLQFTIQVDSGAGVTAPGWLTVRLLKGATPARIPVAADQSGLQPGKYSARILVNTADGRQNIVTVNLTVTAADPQLDVSPGYLRFAGPASALAPSEQSLLIRNTGGGGPLSFQASVVGDAPWLSVAPDSGQAGPNAPASLRVLVNAQGLALGAQRGLIRVTSAAGSADIPVSLLVRDAGPVIGFNVTGLRFESREGNGNSRSKSASVLNLGQGTVNWTAAVVSDAPWISLGATSGSATAAAPGTLAISVDPGALDDGNYSALIRFTDPGALNSPQFFSVMLTVGDAADPPNPDPTPSGLFFIGKTGGSATAAQVVRVFTSSVAPVPFQVSANTADGANWLSVDPAGGSLTTQSPGQVNVTANPATLRPGVYTGDITVAFSSTLIRSTNVTLVVQPATTAASPKTRDAAGCTPARLALNQTGLVNSFAAPVGWPSSMVVRLADDCGDPVLNGQVVTTFSNGDPALALKLTDPSAGLYSGTWAPGKTTAQMTVSARATAPNLAAATADITGSVTPNKVPILAPNGTLNNLNPVVGAPLAPGTVAQVYGSNLATTQAEPGVIPLPATFNGTRMLVGAFVAPLFFLSDGQLNVQIPTELQPGKDYPVVVEANGGYTLPDTLTISPAQPGVLTFADKRLIAQHAADFSLITPDSPARQDEAITLYLVGMGATDPAIASGAPAPTNRLAPASNQTAVTIGGKAAALFFAGLTPGSVGLYQINLTVPTGLQAGDVPVVITQGGAVANASLLPVR
jgi:uncharacterized protein (TIGR03437 family)